MSLKAINYGVRHDAGDLIQPHSAKTKSHKTIQRPALLKFLRGYTQVYWSKGRDPNLQTASKTIIGFASKFLAIGIQERGIDEWNSKPPLETVLRFSGEYFTIAFWRVCLVSV